MKLWDGTRIFESTVDRGLVEWETMATDLDKRMSEMVAKVKEALAAAPWGSGTEGRAFWQAHCQDDGPDLMLGQCSVLAEEILGEAGRVRSAVGNTLEVDKAMKEDLAAMTRRV